MRLTTAALAFAIASLPAIPQARNLDGQWNVSQNDTEFDKLVKDWYAHLMQPDLPYSSCCGESDAYWADSWEVNGDQYVAIVTDERTIPGRPPIPVGTKIVIPNFKLKIDQGNPTGHGVIFVSYRPYNQHPYDVDGWHVFCYIQTGGG
jgi:hypothetical protein